MARVYLHQLYIVWMPAVERDVTWLLRHWIIKSQHYNIMKIIICFAFFGQSYFLQLSR